MKNRQEEFQFQKQGFINSKKQMKFIFSEKQINKISKHASILSEQTSRCDFENWTNGDGITRPKVTVSESETEVVTTFEGPESGFCIQHSQGGTNDTIHQLSPVTSKVVGKHLKNLYNQGIYVYPDLDNIKMVKDDNYFSIKIPLVKTTENNAVTSIERSGGLNHEGLFDQLEPKITSNTNNKLIKTTRKKAEGGSSGYIVEHWICWRDISSFPFKTTPPPINNPQNPIVIQADKLSKFREEIKSKTKGISISNKMKLKSSPAYRLTIYPGEKKIKSMTFIYDNVSMENLEKRFNEKIKSANPTAKVIKKGQVSNTSKKIWYMLILFK